MKKTVLLVLLLGFVIYVTNVYAAEDATLTLETDVDQTNNNVVTTVVKVSADPPFFVQGYSLHLTFPTKDIEITNIKYLFGTVSKGLGDDNDSLKTINTKGLLKIQGELASAQGGRISNNTEIAQIQYKKNNNTSISYKRESGILYKIGPGGRLDEIKIQSSNQSNPSGNKSNSFNRTTDIFEKIINFIKKLI